MRTKTLILTAALGAAGIATSMAQVFSVNAVGYINVTIPAGKIQMVANQLIRGANTLAEVIPTAPDGTIVYSFLPNGTYDVSTYLDFLAAWDPNPAIPMGPGVGAFISNPTASPMTLTFVGDVPQNTPPGTPLTTPIPPGLSIRSSKVPQAGTLPALGYTPGDGDICYQFNPADGSYTVNTYLDFLGAWDPLDPNIAVGEAFFIFNNGVAKSWTRSFTVN